LLIGNFLTIFLGKLLANGKLLGTDCRNFAFDGVAMVDEKGRRVFGDMHTGNEFLESEAYVRLKCGPHVKFLGLIIGCDKTHVIRTGAVKMCPVYLSIANFSTGVLKLDDSRELLGYCPEMPIKDPLLKFYLNKAGIITQEGQKNCCINLKRYFEQTFFRAVFEPLLNLETSGETVRYRLGDSLPENIVEFAVRILVMNCKYLFEYVTNTQ